MVLGNPEMRSYVWLQTRDGPHQQLENEVALLCPRIRRAILENLTGFIQTRVISLRKPDKFATYDLIFDFCRSHLLPYHSSQEHKTFDEKIVRVDFHTFCEFCVAAENLQLKPLIELCFQAINQVVAGKTSKQIREIFGLPDVLTKEESARLDNDPRIQVLNRFLATKKKEFEERQKLMYVELRGDNKDERSNDDEGKSFINGEDGGGIRASKNKKKNRRKKDRAKGPSKTANDILNEVSHHLPFECPNDNPGIALDSSSSKRSMMEDISAIMIAPNFDFKDDDHDDALDRESNEKLDREVQNFEQILKTTWHDRLQEVLSLSEDSVLLLTPTNDNRSTL